MKVFISWSGSRSHSLAKALHEWLPLVLHYIEPWLSQTDIKAGERWSAKVAEELAATNFGVICVTKDSINAPWLLFEAGALAKSMDDGKVIPLLLDVDVKEISGPLAQFQAKKVEKNGIYEVITSINKVAASPVPEARLNQLFESLWSSLDSKVSEIPKDSVPAKQSRPQNEILEELVSGFRGLEMRIRETSDFGSSNKRRRVRHMHPEMIMHMSHRVGEGPHDPIHILFLVSSLREDIPWFYELGIEAYKALKSGDSDASTLMTYRKFMEAVDMLLRGPFLDEIGADKRTYMMLQESLSMLEFNFGKLENFARKHKEKKKSSL